MSNFGKEASSSFAGAVLGVIILASGVLGAAAPVYAAAGLGDPTVVVVRDTTGSGSCWLTWASNNVPYKTMACPAGSELSSFNIPLSQALASGEAYVVLPPHNASLPVQQQVREQILALFATVDARYHRTPPASLDNTTPVIPDSCSGNYTVWEYWKPFNHSTVEYSVLHYQRCSGSMVNLTYSTQVLSGTGAIFYWDHDQYAAGYWNTECAALTSTVQMDPLNQQHNAGYYYEPFDDADNQCLPEDNYSYFDIGPVN